MTNRQIPPDQPNRGEGQNLLSAGTPLSQTPPLAMVLRDLDLADTYEEIDQVLDGYGGGFIPQQVAHYAQERREDVNHLPAGWVARPGQQWHDDFGPTVFDLDEMLAPAGYVYVETSRTSEPQLSEKNMHSVDRASGLTHWTRTIPAVICFIFAVWAIGLSIWLAMS